jgi:hypothetical protein
MPTRDRLLRKLRPILGFGAFIVLMIGLVSLPDHRAGSASASTRHPTGPQVTVRSLTPIRAMPRSFFGLSTEYWTLPFYERRPQLLDRVLSLLHVPGDGPMVLRIGGDSADHARWDPSRRWMDPWVFRVTPSWLAATARLVRDEHLRVILDMNLVTGSALGAGQWARAAERAFPRHSIAAFEIGNEPDLYVRKLWVALLAQARAGVLPSNITPAVYGRDFSAYAHTLLGVAHGATIAGPAIANPELNLRWVASLLAHRPVGLHLVTAHRYPYSACSAPGMPGYPTITRLLSPRATVGVVQSIEPALRLAHRAGLPFRLTELNSVTCGGRAGVSNTFVTALWAPDALFQLLRAGVDGVNLHAREYAVNAPFTISAHGLRANPLLYGLIMFTRAVGPGAQLLHTQITGASRLDAWTVRLRGGLLHVLLIDKGRRPLTVAVHLPARGSATMQRMLAPSVAATHGVTIAGQHLGSDGQWQGKAVITRVPRGGRGYVLTLPGHSAALLSAHAS